MNLISCNGAVRQDRFEHLSDQLISALDVKDARSLTELVYLLDHDEKRCTVCGEGGKFLSYARGYELYADKYCSACAASSPERAAKKLEGNRQAGEARRGNKNAWSEEARSRRIQTNIERHGGENVMSSQVVQVKVKQTLQDRYGTSSSFIATEAGREGWKRGYLKAKTEETKKKQAETNLERFGVTTCLVKEDVKADLKVQRGITTLARVKSQAPAITLLEPYQGHSHLHHWRCETCSSIFVDHVNDGGLPRCVACDGPKTQQGDVFKFIKSLDSDLDVRYNTRTVIAPLELDIYVPEKRLAIEYNGVYWHSDVRRSHLDKTLACKALGIQLLHVFEDEWMMKGDVWRSMIAVKLGFSTRIYARDCQVGVIAHQVGKEFLERSHLRGSVPARFYYGLYRDEELMGVASFGKPRFSKEADHELLRIAFKLDHHVVGGVGKLITNAIKHFKMTSLLTYVDRTLGEGTAYEHLGFRHVRDTPPGYFYLLRYKRWHRTSFQKHKLSKLLETFNPSLTEAENMKLAGYTRIYDCGHRLFLWRAEA